MIRDLAIGALPQRFVPLPFALCPLALCASYCLLVIDPAPLQTVPLTLWQAAILGLVEGITEYLPVSSTGHLILASDLMGLDQPPQRKAAVDAFNIVIQGGAILAVVGLYWPTVLRMLKGALGQDHAGLRLAINLFIAFVPAAAVGLLLDDWIEARLFHPGPVVAALIAGGVFMIVLDMWQKGRLGGTRWHKARTESVLDVTPRQALTIGCAQILAMWPGTSRSMMTITGGYLAGLAPRAAAEFSFLLGVLTLSAASGYSLLKNLRHAEQTGQPNLFEVLGVWPVVVGILVAAVSAAIAVKWLVGFLTRHGLAPFGWYRIVLGVVLLVLVWRGVVGF